jgi:hypothetical protein
MPKLSALRVASRTVNVTVDGGTIAVEYRPNVYTAGFLAELADQSVTEALCALLAGWDLTDDEGVALPITTETLADFPLPLLQAIWRGVQEDVLPGN